MSRWSSTFVHANGIQLHYHRTGPVEEGDRPVLILAHGITDNGLCWARLAQQFEDHFDVIMVDARGHGKSDRPAQGHNSADHAADLAALIDTLDVVKPVLMGHSMGARSVAQLAADYPELPAGIILEDPAWFEPQPLESTAEQKVRMEQWRDNLLAQQRTSKEKIMATGKAENPAWDETEFGAWAEAKLQVDADVLVKSSFRGDWTEVVTRITCPTLLVTADTSRGAIISEALAQRAEQLNPQLHSIKISGAGHSIRREQFAGVVSAIETFLGNHHLD